MRERNVIEIGAAVQWAYQAQLVDRAGVGRAEACLGFRSSNLSPLPSGGGVARLVYGTDVHPDAETIHAAVLHLDPVQRGLVLDYGHSGVAPDWLPGARPVMCPLISPNGRPAMIWSQKRAAIACHITEGVEVVSSDGGRRVRRGMPHKAILLARASWLLWWDALESLVGLRLTSMELLPLATPRKPWKVATLNRALDNSTGR